MDEASGDTSSEKNRACPCSENENRPSCSRCWVLFSKSFNGHFECSAWVMLETRWRRSLPKRALPPAEGRSQDVRCFRSTSIFFDFLKASLAEKCRKRPSFRISYVFGRGKKEGQKRMGVASVYILLNRNLRISDRRGGSSILLRTISHVLP